MPTLAERAWYNARASFYLGTSLGAAQLNLVAKERQMVEAGAKDDELLREFYPALLENRSDQKGHREAALRSLRSAPQRHMDILADLARYNAMKGYSSMAEAAVALIGQVGGGLPTPETLAGSLGKGVTWGARFLSGAWRQGAVNAVVNPAVQALAIAGGGQEKYDPWQHAMSVGVGSIVGGAGSALFGRPLEAGASRAAALAPTMKVKSPKGVGSEELTSSVEAANSRALVPWEGPVTLDRFTVKTPAQLLAEAETSEKGKWGAYFFNDSTKRQYIDKPTATLGRPGGAAHFSMPLEDAGVVVDAHSAYKHTGGAPTLQEAYKAGESVWGVMYSLDGLPKRLPKATDTDLPHYLDGGQTALRLHDGRGYMINSTREFVIPGVSEGRPMPSRSVLFEVGKLDKIIRRW